MSKTPHTNSFFRAEIVDAQRPALPVAGTYSLSDVKSLSADTVDPSDIGSVGRAMFDLYKHGYGHTSTGLVVKDVFVDSPASVNMYLRDKAEGEEEPEPTPAYSGTYDIGAFVRTLRRSSYDISASITAIQIPTADFYANIRAWSRENTDDLGSSISGVVDGIGDVYGLIKGFASTHTRPLEYERYLIGTPGGMSLVSRLITTMPDLTASISGWDYSNLTASLVARLIHSSYIYANITPIIDTYADLLASIVSTYTYDINGSLAAVPPEDISGSLVCTPPSDIQARIEGYGPKELNAFCGGHLPKYLTASLLVNQPKPLYAYIIAGGSSTFDLSASVTASGGWSNISARVDAGFYSSSDVGALLIPRVPVDLVCGMHGWQLSSIAASIEGCYSNDIGGYITGWKRENEYNLPSFIRSTTAGSDDVETFIYGWIHAHTTDKPYNEHLWHLFKNGVLLGQFGGLTRLTLEPVRGIFPDLHATITGRPFYTSEFRAFIRPGIPTHKDLSASLSAVTDTINISKVTLNFVNIKDLSVYISAFSGIGPLSANIRGIVNAQTGTPSGAGWVRTSYSVKFYIGTNKGLFIPPAQTSVLRPDYFINKSDTPDLWAYAYGWDRISLSASISIQPYSNVLGTITPQDLSHISYLLGSIQPYTLSSIAASITASGGFSDLATSISVAGEVSTLGASIYPYVKILGYRIIPVETKPFLDMRAIINPAASCAGTSSYRDLSVFIRAGSVASSQGYLYASIYPRTDIIDMGVSITGRIFTRMDVMTLAFRTRTRSSSGVSAVLTGIGRTYLDLVSSIKGVPHEKNLGASVVAARYKISTDGPLDNIKVYKEDGQYVYLYKELSLALSSQVKTYIYDSIDKMLYPIDGGRWALNLSEFTELDDFYSRDENDRTRDIDSLEGYDSIDEAIRAAISILTERRRSDIGASISASGGFSSLGVFIEGKYADRVIDLGASISQVESIPYLYASISAFSGYLQMGSYITGIDSIYGDLPSSVRGVVYTPLEASIIGIT